LCDNRSRCGKSCILGESKRVVFVYRPLDGRGRVDDPDPCVFETMQCVHAVYDLFERTAGNGPHQENSAALQRLSAAGDPGCPPTQASCQAGDGKTGGIDATPGQHGLQSRHIPTSTPSDNADSHSRNICLMRSKLTRPAWKERPVAALLMETSAGLKSSGSIL